MDRDKLKTRKEQLDLDPQEFKTLGYRLVDMLSEYLETISQRKLTTGESPEEIRSHFVTPDLTEIGQDPSEILEEASSLLMDHSLHIGHPRFWGFICGSGLPINWLAEMLAASVNPNLGGYVLSPMATEIEKQTIQWLAQLIHCPDHQFGILTSGGNMANMIAFWAARKEKSVNDIQKEGIKEKLICYVSGETHTWIQKAADLSGIGTESVRWISPDENGKMPIDALEESILNDQSNGFTPFLVVANAGSVSTGVVDPIIEMSKICKKYNLWLHADGAYGGVAASIPNIDPDLNAIHLADSIAIDPHKWLYSSLEAGCTLVRDQVLLENAFSYKPPYYKYEEHEKESPTNFYQLGPQNSRNFRALKVWMALKQAGRKAYTYNLKFDISLAKAFFEYLSEFPQLEAHTHHLSIVTFRYIPKKYLHDKASFSKEISEFNENLLLKIQEGGKAFFSNAILKDIFYLRICIVNHRTTWMDLEELPKIIQEAAHQIEKP